MLIEKKTKQEKQKEQEHAWEYVKPYCLCNK